MCQPKGDRKICNCTWCNIVEFLLRA